jgi:hypothetical protein
VGLKELPSALSIVWTSVVIPCLFAEPIALSLGGHAEHASVSVQVLLVQCFPQELCVYFCFVTGNLAVGAQKREKLRIRAIRHSTVHRRMCFCRSLSGIQKVATINFWLGNILVLLNSCPIRLLIG